MRTTYHIAIEGTIGVGKSSLANILAEKLDARVILEEFEENPFLSEFYNDPERFAFQTQLFFLLSRYRQQLDLQQTELFSQRIISDYMFAKDRLFASLNLDDKEMSLYNSVANLLEKNIIYPDLVIFLQSDTDRLMENIKYRGRDYEMSIDWNYIDALNQIYNEYFFRYNKSPLLIINTNDLDFVNRNEDLNEILEFIRKPVLGTKFYNPIKRR
ncbi:MAG: deoxynucleoside kinase [Candidatus Marinimicrobia bacterium]|nr:deoxynucleoside kinase [Candidatus Neomarinimicrobiota bacterium]MBT3634466.1 deoxynucleoside kinase [Candidatus Neomarinimicrobiota bacterium]MBT3683292.1 deoxynucleoside kinase [Candidatus Neomarinimicrobiota bacterium]MBT3760181.1 deoxynucleoside kinase [Candidatus Neomarinimicrobiota bacterium]MBT3896276.1 deoxynucleoside kinase [Candidatus Neomarinimicrobiota bacterium]